jgi:thioredoxin 1
VHLNSKNFNTVTTREAIVMVDCWAEWCSACQSFNPIYETVAEKYPDHTFAKLDTVTEKDLVSKLGIEHIPTLLLFREGFLLFQQPGYYEEDKLEDIIRQAESINMEEVRAHFEAEENSEDKKHAEPK